MIDVSFFAHYGSCDLWGQGQSCREETGKETLLLLHQSLQRSRWVPLFTFFQGGDSDDFGVVDKNVVDATQKWFSSRQTSATQNMQTFQSENFQLGNLCANLPINMQIKPLTGLHLTICLFSFCLFSWTIFQSRTLTEHANLSKNKLHLWLMNINCN